MPVAAPPLRSGTKAVEPTARPISLSSVTGEARIAILTAICLFLYLFLRYGLGIRSWQSSLPLYLALIIGGVPLLISLFRKAIAGEFGSDFLAAVSMVSSVLLGEYLVGAIIVLMYSGGGALESYATGRASSVLDALARRMPRIARRKTSTGLIDQSLDNISPGDTLVVLPHEICPVDGTVSEGQGRMDESYLTGEPYLQSKSVGSPVLSGSINGDTALTIVADKLHADSRYAKIMEVMRATEENRPKLRRIADRLAAWYTPLALAIAAIAWIYSGDPIRFLAVVVIATPCPLLIAIPVAIVGAISLAARHSIIIKNPAILEQITNCRTLIFDKTGTLTIGKPRLTEIVCASGFTREEVLRAAASLEGYSKHPLAQAIIDAAQDAHLATEPVTQLSEKPGQGIDGIVAGHHVRITGRSSVEDLSVKLPPVAAGLECLVFLDGSYAATFRFRDAPRKESSPFIRHLGPAHNVERVLLVSGDRESEARYLANQVGIRDIYADQSPEEKVAIVTEETRRHETAFIGDGINDAPALAAATVGIAFGSNSDITSEAADAVVLTSSLETVDELIHIGHRMRSIALQSAVGGILLSTAGMFAAAFGYLPPLEGAIAQEFIDLAALLNVLRVAFPRGQLADVP